MTSERFQTIIKELFIRCRKLNTSPEFIRQSYFFINQIAINHSAGIGYKDLLKIYRNCTKEPYSFMTIDTALPADNPMKFRNKFSDSLL